jgi:hypothetical protein
MDTGSITRLLPWEIVVNSLMFPEDDQPENMSLSQIPSLSLSQLPLLSLSQLPSQKTMYDEVWIALRYRAQGSFRQLLEEETKEDGEGNGMESENGVEFDNEMEEDIHGLDVLGSDQSDAEDDDDPLAREQLEVEIPDEDLETVNGVLNFDHDEDLIRLISEQSLKTLPWRVGEGKRSDSDDLYSYQHKVVGIKNISKPVDLFLHLWPLSLWETIAVESERYREQNGWTRIKTITTQEIICYAGLLVARSLHPWASGLKNHWRTTSEGMYLLFLLYL